MIITEDMFVGALRDMPRIIAILVIKRTYQHLINIHEGGPVSLLDAVNRAQRSGADSFTWSRTREGGDAWYRVHNMRDYAEIFNTF
jgi:hypothetical protein